MSQGDSNGRVTVAVLGTKLDNLISLVTEMKGRLGQIDERQDAECRRVDRLDSYMRIVIWVGGVLGSVVIALAIAWLNKALGL